MVVVNPRRHRGLKVLHAWTGDCEGHDMLGQETMRGTVYPDRMPFMCIAPGRSHAQHVHSPPYMYPIKRRNNRIREHQRMLPHGRASIGLLGDVATWEGINRPSWGCCHMGGHQSAFLGGVWLGGICRFHHLPYLFPAQILDLCQTHRQTGRQIGWQMGY